MTSGPGTEVRVRPAQPAEFARIALLTVAAYRHDHQVHAGHPYEAVLANVADRAAAGELLVAEAPEPGQVVGSVLYVRHGSRYAELCGPGEAEFRTLAVDPAAQRRGVGEALVRACLARARAESLQAVVIYTRDFATGAHRLYRKFGFERTPARDWAPRRGVNLWALRCSLTEPSASAAESIGS